MCFYFTSENKDKFLLLTNLNKPTVDNTHNKTFSERLRTLISLFQLFIKLIFLSDFTKTVRMTLQERKLTLHSISESQNLL